MTKNTCLALLLACAAMPIFAQSSSKNDKAIFAEFDKMLAAAYPADGNGATALVARKGQIIYKKAFGLADIEMGVAMRPEMIFRIGSVSKQFTAVAILQLAEQGKLSLQDEITKFLPDYPTKGYKITVEHLLTHTSGIASYTDMEKWTDEVRRKDFTTLELIDFFKNEPFDFEPNTDWNYSNSGYVLLGYIIEKISGKSYENYIEEHIFSPLAMMNSHYDNTLKIIKNRARGYEPADKGYMNTPYLSMTQPHAAGSLLSTVEDLFKWSEGLKAHKVISKESLDKAYKSYILANGKDTYYGYGWQIGDLLGSPTVQHSGGINGFVSNAIYLPNEDVYVVVLSNCTCAPPGEVSTKMAALAIGKTFNFKKIELKPEALDEYIAVYENEMAGQRIISKENNELYSQRSGGNKFRILPYEKDKFYFENSLTVIEFSRDASGKINGAKTMQAGLPPMLWNRSEKPMPTGRQAITLPKETLEKYVGSYELKPNFILTISLKDGELLAQATAQAALPIFAEKEHFFFYKIVDAQLEFSLDANGKVVSVTLHQGGQKMVGKKI